MGDASSSADARAADAGSSDAARPDGAPADAAPPDAAAAVWTEEFGITTEGAGEVAFPIGTVDAIQVSLPAMTVTGLGAILTGTPSDSPEQLRLGLYPVGGNLLVDDSAGLTSLAFGTRIVAVTPTTVAAGSYWVAITGPQGVEIAWQDAQVECLVYSANGLPASLPAQPNTVGCGTVNLFVVGTPPSVTQ